MKTYSKSYGRLQIGEGILAKITFILCLLGSTFASKAGEIQWSDLTEKRVLVLGDSITYGGQYVAYLEAYLQLKFPDQSLELLNLGLPSETVSGLSEKGHAGGNFPRPDLHERLDRTLEQIKPEIVLACYGMNCGIYHPYGIDRFEAYKVGMRRLRDRVRASGAEMIHLTPPVFDPLPISKRTLPAGLKSYSGPYAGYDEVLNLYAAWLIAMRSEGWNVIDIHGPMKAALLLRRQSDPSFHFAGDGVHMNAQAHWLTAQLILEGLGASDDFSAWSSAEAMVTSFLGKETECVSLIKSKQRMLCDTWLTHIGHLRPGMAMGLTLDASKTKSIEMDSQIESLLK